LYHEATDFLRLRAERLKWVQQGGDRAEDDGRGGRKLIGQRQRLRRSCVMGGFCAWPISGEAWFRNYSNKYKLVILRASLSDARRIST